MLLKVNKNMKNNKTISEKINVSINNKAKKLKNVS
jgi:hypothetical protein